MNSDLIERLHSVINKVAYAEVVLTVEEWDALKEAIAALSPVLPEDTATLAEMLREAECWVEADLVERQGVYVSGLRTANASLKVTCAELEIKNDQLQQRIDKLTAPVLPEDVKEVLADLDDAKTEFFNLGSKGYAADIRSGMNLIERLYRDKSRLEYLRAMDERIRLKQYQRIDELEKEKENLLESALCILMPNCTKHTGDMTPPLSEFLDKFAGRCAVCDRQRIDELEAALKNAASWLSLRTPVTVRDQIEASWKGEEHEEKLEGKP